MCSGGMSSSARAPVSSSPARLSWMAAPLQLLNDLVAERWQINRVSAGDQTLVNHHFHVDPLAASIADTGSYGRIGGKRQASVP